MKSIASPIRPVAEKPFPKLMVAKSGIIVAFSAPREGFIVGGTDGKEINLLRHSSYWDMADFKDFEGKVTLSNDD